MPWKCICGEMVNDRYPAHTHASIPRYWDDMEMKWKNFIGRPPEVWTYERDPADSNGVREGKP